jgi:hypothetical protein
MRQVLSEAVLLRLSADLPGSRFAHFATKLVVAVLGASLPR